MNNLLLNENILKPHQGHECTPNGNHSEPNHARVCMKLS